MYPTFKRSLYVLLCSCAHNLTLCSCTRSNSTKPSTTWPTPKKSRHAFLSKVIGAPFYGGRPMTFRLAPKIHVPFLFFVTTLFLCQCSWICRRALIFFFARPSTRKCSCSCSCPGRPTLLSGCDTPPNMPATHPVFASAIIHKGLPSPQPALLPPQSCPYSIVQNAIESCASPPYNEQTPLQSALASAKPAQCCPYMYVLIHRNISW